MNYPNGIKMPSQNPPEFDQRSSSTGSTATKTRKSEGVASESTASGMSPRLNFERLSTSPVAPVAPQAVKQVAQRAEQPARELEKASVTLPEGSEDDFNPMLDDDDEDGKQVAEAPDEVVNYLLDEDDNEDEVLSSVKRDRPKATGGKRRKFEARGEDRLKAHLANLSSSSRFRVTEKDEAMFRFLSRVRYSPAEHLAVVLGDTKTSTYERLNRLYRRGYLERRAVEGGSSVYFLSTVGRDYIDSETRVIAADFALSHVPHTVQVNRLTASLLARRDNEVSRSMPSSMLKSLTLTTEPELKRHIAARARHRSGVIKGASAYRTLSSDKRVAYHEFKKSPGTTPPELTPGMEWVLGIYDGDGKYHYPDLVIQFPRQGEKDRGLCVAVEVELSAKSLGGYKAILNFYKKEMLTGDVYQSVIWVVKSDRIRRLLEEARTEVGIPEKRCQIIDLQPKLGLEGGE